MLIRWNGEGFYIENISPSSFVMYQVNECLFAIEISRVWVATLKHCISGNCGRQCRDIRPFLFILVPRHSNNTGSRTIYHRIQYLGGVKNVIYHCYTLLKQTKKHRLFDANHDGKNRHFRRYQIVVEIYKQLDCIAGIVCRFN